MSTAVAAESPDTGRRKSRTVDVDQEDDDNSRMKIEPDSDIKDYAETTMNELLGWYGLDKLDTRGLNLKNLNHHFPTSSSSSSPQRHDDESEEEMGPRSRSPIIESESLVSNPSNETIICAWCLKTGLKLFTLKTSSGKTKVFCSEPCFNQCRRAAFKKNRVCNWCRHVRHTVNYVDFKDGDEQLQFCSDKCLNQYKMQIFCRETQAYLQMNPHLQEETKNSGTANSKLITPDLWLRDCQEATNGGSSQNLSNSDDDQGSLNLRNFSQNSTIDEDLEDLSMKSKSERPNAITFLPREHSQEMRKNSESSSLHKDQRSLEMCNALVSYLREDKDKNTLDRRKRHFENDREHFKKKQRSSSLRHRINHHQEAPPAHLASAIHPPSINFSGQSRLFPPSIPPYLPSNASSPLNPPIAHSKTMPSHSVIGGSLLPPGLPPPPPLLNSDFLHSQFNPQLFQPQLNSITQQQQQLEAFLRMQSSLGRQSSAFSSHLLPPSETSSLSSTRTPPPPHYNPGASLQPNTVMLPYPVFLPLPVPIPIPIPLSCFLKKDQKQPGSSNVQEISKNLNGDNMDEKHSDSDVNDKAMTILQKLKSSKADSNDFISKKEKMALLSETSSYAVTNNDSQTNRLILTRHKKR